jgi:hypothetical protein
MAGCIAIAGCESNPAQPTCTFSLSTTSMTMGAAGGAGSVTVTTGNQCAWAASSGAAWITATGGTSATGSGVFTFTVAALASTAPRTGTLNVAGQAVTVTQAGRTAPLCAYEVAPVDVRACMAEGFVRTVDVTTSAGCGWTSSTSATWLTIAQGRSGTGPGTISYTLAANYDAARQATIEVRWPTQTAGQNVRVAQAGCRYGVSRDAIDAPAAGGDFAFDVVSQSTDDSCGGPLQSGCMWSTGSSASWATVLGSMPRVGDDRVSIRVAANGGAARTAAITVRDRTVTIRQAGS